MARIITITFNPAIDKSTSVDKILPDKKLKCEAPEFDPGGGGVNVARAIKRLGDDAIAIFPAGGHTGAFFNVMLKKEHVRFIALPFEGITRENLIVRESSTNNQFRFGMPGPALQTSEWMACLQEAEKLIQADFLVVSGSLAAGMPLTVFDALNTTAKNIHAKLVIDLSGPALKQAVESGAYLIKPNLGELAGLVGKSWIDKQDIEPICRKIIESGKCQIIIASMGPDGAFLVTADKSYSFKPPVVERKSTVGAGDSMLAGIILSLSKGNSLSDSLKYGIACGTAATMNTGTELCRPEQVNEILKRM